VTAADARTRGVTVGDIAPRFALPDAEGETIDPYSDDLAGNPTVVVFCPNAAAPQSRALLAAIEDIRAQLADLGGRVLAVTRGTAAANADLGKQLGLGFPVLADPQGGSFRLYGVTGDGKGGDEPPATFLLGPNQHLRLALRGDGADHAARVLDSISLMAAARRSEVMAPHPPVLIVPDVLSKADCQRLMTVFAMEGNVWVEPGHGNKGLREDYKMRVPDYGRQDRVDHWVMNPGTRDFIVSRLGARLFPEIRKAFQYRITKFENFRIACYEGARGGEPHGHRDNSEPLVAHRRFAVSINLNTEEFEGGSLRFPEFGGQIYRPAAGAAIAFSCSLLHEVLPVTSGRRFVVLAFLAGDH
jgi:peroxiredoxin